MPIKNNYYNNNSETSTGFEKKSRPELKQTISNDVTSFSIDDIEYYSSLPQNVDIFKGVNLKITEIENESIKKCVYEFLNIFRFIIEKNNRIMRFDNNLPKLKMEITEDGAALIHWNYKHIRIGFAFEEPIEESSYYLVFDNKVTGSYFSKSEFLDRNNFHVIIEKLLMFVLETT